MAEIVITVPGAPASKGRPRFSRLSGRAYTPETTVVAENWVKMRAIEAMAERAPFAGAVSLTARMVMAIPKSFSKAKRDAAISGALRPTKKPDCSNHLKMIEDGMNGVVFIDDCQIVDVRVVKVYGEVPGTVVTVVEMDGGSHVS